MNWKKEFVYFLKYNGWLKAFARNLGGEWGELAKERTFEFVGSGFMWDQTPEGFVFWYDIDIDWRRYIEYWENEAI